MIFSRNKYIECSILVMLYLMSMNFFHLGQLFLPLICLLIFIDNKFDFSFLKDKYFLLLIAFAISFFAFSYKLGFYSVMGCCLPMAYYIGTNIKNKDFDSYKKIAYVLALGMATHVVLTFIYTAYLFGINVFIRSPRDVWLKDEISPTAVAALYCFMTGIIYYVNLYEKNKLYKKVILIFFTLLVIYEISLGRRTPLFMLIVNGFMCLVIERFINKHEYKIDRRVYAFFGVIALLSITLFFLYKSNALNMIESYGIIRKFKEYGLDFERFDILLNSFKYMPQYPWGGQFISSQLGIQVHDLWSDIYDYAGIIPFVIIVLLTMCVLIKISKYILDKNVDYRNRIFVFSLSICILMQMALEPAMTGCSILVICSTIVFSMLRFL